MRTRKAPVIPCEWKEDDADCGCWRPACGGDLFVLNAGTPAENKMKFCPFCGKPLKEVPYKEEDDD